MKLKMQSKLSYTNNVEPNIEKKMDESVFEQICEAIFLLIPEGIHHCRSYNLKSHPKLRSISCLAYLLVPRLKQLFLSWSLLSPDEKLQIDTKVCSWFNPGRRQLYKPLQEALTRWENVQDTQGAPGCEPGMVSFSCDPQLEEELVNVICSLEMMFAKHENKDQATEPCNTTHCSRVLEEASLSARNSPRSVGSPKDRTLHSVYSCGYITSSKHSEDDFSGYMTN
ncbi:uncharacterized protein LOC105691159 [Athalia rosae]|uniref:uncharacterized protein LOC105691159 n=1 Tax=Athalia rosae TaxID=37344 RepID=UPI0020343548|nr:uncharacterized protein LOC105691159 [Athalia rosae]